VERPVRAGIFVEPSVKMNSAPQGRHIKKTNMANTCPQIYIHVVFAVEYDRKYIFKTDEH
jgi:hypothetical protein